MAKILEQQAQYSSSVLALWARVKYPKLNRLRASCLN